MGSSPITSWQIEGRKVEAMTYLIFLGSKLTMDGDCHLKLKDPVAWKVSYDKPRQCIKNQRHHFADEGPYCQSYSFSDSHVWT